MNQRKLNPIQKTLGWLFAGICFVVAMIGVVVPGLPTTPFLLLMCFFLIQVSPRLHQKALQMPFVGPAIRDWEEQKGVSPRVKLTACTTVAIVFCVTVIVWNPGTITLIVVAAASLIGVLTICLLPTAQKPSSP